MDIDCDKLKGRRRHVCQGHDDDGNPVDMTEEKRMAFLRRWSETVSKPEKIRRTSPKRSSDDRTISCEHLGGIVGHWACKCGGKRKVEVHECRLLKTKVTPLGAGGRPKLCVPLQRDHKQLKDPLERAGSICCEHCEHRSPVKT